ncbi:hypothetical protein OBBRIDRAFT_605270 [Obba rivulosa]|uniref:Uncharacterized protein n=1 Tax=Obba rivulosa TaxID=1052685 RepID=A0A8E2DLX9_9APHY|nr:hypothetical protein OBBRIDRAFT_605270 [Obba rivulosa]
MPFDAPPEFAPGQPKSTRRSVNASTGDRENLPPPDSPGSLDPPSAGREGSHPHTAGSASPQRDVVLSIHIVGEDEPPCRFPASIHAAGGRMLVRIDGRAELGRAHRHYLLNVPVPDPAATGCYSWPMPIDERAFNDILRATAGPTVAPPPSPARLPLTDIPLNGAMQPPPTGHRAGFYPPVTFVPLVRPPPKVSPTLPSVPLSGAVRRPPQQALPVPRTVLNIIRDPTTRPPHFSLFPNHAHPHVVAPGPRRLPPFPLPCPPADPAPVPVTLNGTVHDLYPSSAVRVTLEGIRGLRPRRRPTPAELQASQEFLAHLRHLASQREFTLYHRVPCVAQAFPQNG